MLSHFLRKFWPFARRVCSAGVSTVRAGSRVWHLTPDAGAILGPAGPDLDRWLADGLAEVVKTGPYRTVYRVRLPGGTVYVKQCRVCTPRAWAREVLRPAKARLEFENALALRDRGIPAVLPVAWGNPDSRWPGESTLITRGRDAAVPFVHLVEQVLPDLPPDTRNAVRRQLARGLGQFMARLHDAGVAHPDPHPGNLLVELPASRAPRFFLIDLHAVRIGRPLTWAESRANLVLYNRWFQLRASRPDRQRFWRAYRRSRQTLPPATAAAGGSQAREVERGTLASNLRFWAGRERRCLGTNRYFRRVRNGSVRGFAVRDLPDGFLAELLTDPDAAFTRPGVKLLKDSRTSTVAEVVIPTPDGPRHAVLKRVRVRRWFEPVKNLFRLSPALRSWAAGHSLRDRWLPTPWPLAVLHLYRRGLSAEGYLLVEKVSDAVGLPEAVAGLASLPGSERRSILRAWVDRLARLLRGMHDRAVSHRDLKAPNVVLAGAATDPAGALPVLIDLVGVRTGVRVSFRQRAKELARLNASFLNCPLVTRSLRLRFLRAYLAAGPRPRDGWKTWWNAVSRATAAKVAKNRRSGRELT
jgi:tRNA A-37 threonylcarbamoyl transferase component Bud32